ncbi:MAG: DUF58 domain-containing protein [Candidatus Cloacimonetes bacterium]|nr:DUF58 domain-containing protein [Candidatus Cloacimonadota bacterium]
MIGLHKSPYHGFSVEFSDHRQYNPGDPLRNIDWKVYAKTGRYYIRRYEEETNLKCYLIVDHSKSMGYSSGKVSKLQFSSGLASALAYLMMKQQDAVGLLTFTNRITNYLPPRALRKYLDELLKTLYLTEAQETTSTAAVLHELAGRIKRRGLIILISDMMDDPDEILSGLNHFRYQKHEVVLFHVQDKQELEFSFKQETRFEDAETGETITVSPWQIKDDYLRSYGDITTYLKKKCHESRIEYNAVSTETPFEECLFKYLVKRAKML